MWCSHWLIDWSFLKLIVSPLVVLVVNAMRCLLHPHDSIDCHLCLHSTLLHFIYWLDRRCCCCDYWWTSAATQKQAAFNYWPLLYSNDLIVMPISRHHWMSLGSSSIIPCCALLRAAAAAAALYFCWSLPCSIEFIIPLLLHLLVVL